MPRSCSGALDGTSVMYGGPAPDPHTEFYGVYFQDDWKVNSRVTVNLGLRDEYEDRLARSAARALHGPQPLGGQPRHHGQPAGNARCGHRIVGSNYYSWNGQWSFTSGSHPGMWNAQKLAFNHAPALPSRLTTRPRSALAMPCTPFPPNTCIRRHRPDSGAEDLVFLEPPFYGMSGNQTTQAPLQGIPQENFSNPFPANTNPLNPILGRNSGPQLGVGGSSLVWYPQNLSKAYNHRFNISIQHEFPGQVVVSGTYFLNLGYRTYTQELNGINPTLELQNETALTQNSVESVLSLFEFDAKPRAALQRTHRFPLPIAGEVSAVRTAIPSRRLLRRGTLQLTGV